MVGGARKRHLAARHVQDPAREIRAGRHEKRGVIEACLAGVIGLDARLMLKMNESHAAGAKRSAVRAAIEHAEAEHVAVESGHSIEVTHLEADRADMQRGAAREGGSGRRIGGVHGQVYRDCRRLAQ
jgi:hypothetical protein